MCYIASQYSFVGQVVSITAFWDQANSRRFCDDGTKVSCILLRTVSFDGTCSLVSAVQPAWERSGLH